FSERVSPAPTVNEKEMNWLPVTPAASVVVLMDQPDPPQLFPVALSEIPDAAVSAEAVMLEPTNWGENVGLAVPFVVPTSQATIVAGTDRSSSCSTRKER